MPSAQTFALLYRFIWKITTGGEFEGVLAMQSVIQRESGVVRISASLLESSATWREGAPGPLDFAGSALFLDACGGSSNDQEGLEVHGGGKDLRVTHHPQQQEAALHTDLVVGNA